MIITISINQYKVFAASDAIPTNADIETDRAPIAWYELHLKIKFPCSGAVPEDKLTEEVNPVGGA